ncbi:hypothetical protein JSY14_03565 [Brachybacterium sp. EF45031]|uniref:hypothetical protein n=1 Tax=Brachybacterium sillae TaxID=2810536 RepID=UPI00217E52A5|nr:hypothetical protein [Brachybacterium sillae]MCS6711136.1 hypothetical protein [Brachybacterium sillae]
MRSRFIRTTVPIAAGTGVPVDDHQAARAQTLHEIGGGLRLGGRQSGGRGGGELRVAVGGVGHALLRVGDGLGPDLRQVTGGSAAVGPGGTGHDLQGAACIGGRGVGGSVVGGALRGARGGAVGGGGFTGRSGVVGARAAGGQGESTQTREGEGGDGATGER